jgi:ZIP family zinc transporter
VIEAFLWGALASGTLLIGAIIAYVSRPGPKLNAVVMAAGAGLLLGSVAYDLIEEALKANPLLRVAASFFLGSAVFVSGDLALDRMGAAKRKNPNGEQADGSSKAIVMGSVLDGIPESFVLGLTVLQGGVSTPLFVGVALSQSPRGHGFLQRASQCRMVIGPCCAHVAACRLVVGHLRCGWIRIDPAAGIMAASFLLEIPYRAVTGARDSSGPQSGGDQYAEHDGKADFAGNNGSPRRNRGLRISVATRGPRMPSYCVVREPWPMSCNYEIRTIRKLPLSGEGGAVERAHPGYRDSAVSGESRDLRDAVRTGRSGDFTRQAVGRRDKGGN